MNIHELIAEICDSNDKLHATIRHWRENCGKLEAQLKIAEKERDEARKALAETESDYMAVRRSLLAERDRLKDEVERLTPNYDAGTPETDAFLDLIDDSEVDLGMVRAKCSDLENERNASRAEVARLQKERDEARKALADLMPFVMEDYFPDCATPEFKRAVEAARKLTHEL